MRLSISVSIRSLPDSMPSATSRNPLLANTSSVASLARLSTLIRPVASQTAQSLTRSALNAAIMVSITRRAPRNRSSTNRNALTPASRSWCISARMLCGSRVRMVMSGLAETAAPQNEQL